MTVSRALIVGALGVAVAGPACSGGGGGGGAGPGRNLAISGGNGQTGNAGAALASPLAVVVREATTSNPVQGVTINWAVTRGGGSVTASSVTDASGIATATRTLGSDSIAQATTASGAGLSGSPVTFSSTSRIQGATQIALSAGNAQTDTIGATLVTAYAVVLRDETNANAPVAGVTVNWSAAGGGSVSAPTSVTNGGGIATVNRILGTTAGAQTAQARVTGLNGNPVSFTATATAGNATAIEKTAGDGGTAVINSMVTYTVTARDRGNNPKAGVVIDWATTGGGGTISPAQSTTGTNGQASSTRTLSGTAGPHTATATANGIAGAPSLTFTTTAVLSSTVAVRNDFFDPMGVNVSVGGTVTWNWNSGGVQHNVTFQDGIGNSATIGSGSHQRTFSGSPRVIPYRCTIHSSDFSSGMVGTVTVQ
jgi:adhesin/invasin